MLLYLYLRDSKVVIHYFSAIFGLLRVVVFGGLPGIHMYLRKGKIFREIVQFLIFVFHNYLR